jgi:hypothetical protein
MTLLQTVKSVNNLFVYYTQLGHNTPRPGHKKTPENPGLSLFSSPLQAGVQHLLSK